jgi:hypothetical protein
VGIGQTLLVFPNYHNEPKKYDEPKIEKPRKAEARRSQAIRPPPAVGKRAENRKPPKAEINQIIAARHGKSMK